VRRGTPIFRSFVRWVLALGRGAQKRRRENFSTFAGKKKSPSPPASRFIKYGIILFRIILYHIISYYIILYRIISYFVQFLLTGPRGHCCSQNLPSHSSAPSPQAPAPAKSLKQRYIRVAMLSRYNSWLACGSLGGGECVLKQLTALRVFLILLWALLLCSSGWRALSWRLWTTSIQTMNTALCRL